MDLDFTDLPDLAAAAVGGAALLCNDEFFAEKENLLRAHAAEWREGVYTDRGKWMDGWETRRRREPGHDWCIVRLGMPGRIRGVIVDTAFFRGNFPESCSIEACEIHDALDLAALESARWDEIVVRSPLAGDTKNRFAIGAAHGARRYTHVRLRIYPDGGVARLRVHGEVVPDLARLRAGGLVDLAALEHGAWVETCSDMFFGSRQNLIKPGPSMSMADGWETKRRRGPGNDWALVRLAARGVVERIELDTTHFKGNAPGRCVVEGTVAPSAPDAWRTLLATPLQPHTRHVFDDALRRVGGVTHVRLGVFPDGGVARLRLWGILEPEEQRGLVRLNGMPNDAAVAALRRCCGSARWAEAMASARPFEDRAALARIAERTWWKLDERDWLEAFASHAKIGERKTPAAGEAVWGESEQRAAAGATATTASALATLNAEYEGRFGFLFIVCASGRSGESMLEELRLRVGRSREVEVRTAAEEQARITRLRLIKLLEELS
jgi:allantoicase